MCYYYTDSREMTGVDENKKYNEYVATKCPENTQRHI